MPEWRFGAVEIHPAQRRAFVDGQIVPLGGRAFDLLCVLVEHRDRVMSKSELLDMVWPGLVVEENNLQTQVSTLRKYLGASAIATVPGRGYRFALAEAAAPAAASASESGQILGNLRALAPALIGRADDLALLVPWLRTERLVSIVGPGGIGKTSLADAAAREHLGTRTQGVWWVDLGPVTTADGVAAAVAGTLGVQLGGSDGAMALAQALAHRELLLVLDNCEHIVAIVAALVQTLQEHAADVVVMATSREPLKLPMERVYRLGPLAVPPAGTPLEAARSFGALQLLELRARALDRTFVLAPDQTETAIALCRQLDGVALAIEMAAARAPLLGLLALEQRLGQSLRLLRHQSRTVPPRQQTLEATLAWSYALLDTREQAVLRCLSVFAAATGLEEIQQVAMASGADAWDALDQLSNLVDRSLLQLEPGETPRYRLLESTRQFAAERLATSPEAAAAMARHADAMRTLAERVDLAYWYDDDDTFLERHGADYPDLSLAFERALHASDAPTAAAALDALFRLDYLRGLFAPIAARTAAAVVLLDTAQGKVRARLQLRLAYPWNLPGAGIDRLGAACEAASAFESCSDQRRHVEALLFSASLLASTGEIVLARDAVVRALSLQSDAESPRMRWMIAMYQGRVCTFDGDAEGYRASCTQQLHWAELAGSPRQAAAARANLADAALLACDWSEATRLATASIDEMKTMDSPRFEALARVNLTAALLQRRDTDAASGAAAAALPAALQQGFFEPFAAHLALLAAQRGEGRVAANLVGFVSAWCSRQACRLEVNEQRAADQAWLLASADLGQGVADLAYRWGQEANLGAARTLAMSLLGIAETAPLKPQAYRLSKYQ